MFFEKKILTLITWLKNKFSLKNKRIPIIIVKEQMLFVDKCLSI